ncbi:MAG: S41 family peptidase [Acidobacteria bacterium]|nr:MAG: S41 family peptidase [Acidobacteriota bacterium]
MKQSRRAGWFIFATLIVCAMLGGFYGPQVEATTANDNDSSFQASLREFTSVYDTIQENYANPVDPNDAIYGPTNSNFLGAIPGMLRTLDPHSNFFDPRAFAMLREDQEGRYFGVGMSIQSRPGKMGKLVTFVAAPIPGSPAFKAGLRPGDVIQIVNGKSAIGLDPSLAEQTDKVAKMLKGPRGTIVHVTIDRDGATKPLSFTITRGEITQPSVDAIFMVKPRVGYIHISRFNETTNTELSQALKKLDAERMDGLVLDLRGNPGGLLQEAVEVSDHFLKKGQLIVYHYGRSSPEKRYYATHGDRGNRYPIVILINRMTASAAEIVTGALQDHDRALVMGETSFGKGLVQTVYPLSDETGLALTTARYYTPSGRLIQRDYDAVSLYDYYYHPSSDPEPHTEVRLTDGGRKVYGGGGITPDVKADAEKLNDVQRTLVQNSVFFTFAQKYLGTHKTISEDFEASEDDIAEFKKFLTDQKIPVTDADLKANLAFVKLQIREKLIEDIYGTDVADRIKVENDPLVDDAAAHLPQAQQLLQNAQKYMAATENK